jgi:hypothetical protein
VWPEARKGARGALPATSIVVAGLGGVVRLVATIVIVIPIRAPERQ